MDLLKIELQQGRLPKDFLSQLRPVRPANAPKLENLQDAFSKAIRSVFESPDDELFETGMDILDLYSDLDEDFELKEYFIAHDDGEHEEFASNFGYFKDYVFSKEGVRGLTSANWSDGIAFTYHVSEGVLGLYVPSLDKDLGVIHLSSATKTKLNELVRRASTMSAGKTFFTDGSGEFVIGK